MALPAIPTSGVDSSLSILEQLPFPITHCSRDLRYVWVNQPYAEWLGRSREEIEGRSIEEVIGAVAFNKLLPHFEHVLSGHPVRYEEEVDFRDLGPRWIKVSYDPLFGDSGYVEGWVAVVNDVTIEQRGLARQRAQEERFRLLADQAPVMIWMSGTDKLCTWFNKPWLDFVGRPLEAELGNGWAENVHADDFAGCSDVYVTSFDKRQPFSMEYRLRRHDGVYRWILDSGIPIFGPNGIFTGYIGSCIDISDRRAGEEALREGHRRKDEFLATLAHELRNPLAPIRNAVEILRAKSPAIPELEWSREIIDRQSKHLSRLVDDLLDLSRITLGKIRLENERIPVASFVVQAVETSRPLIEDNGHALTVDLPPEPLFVNGDLTRLSQVMTNLLNNAAKYTPRGGHLRLSVLRDESNSDRVCVRVSDTGIGIPRDMLVSIFDLFVQVGSPLEHGAGGLGIGLTLAQKVIANHGGTIQALSAGPGLGSEFVIRLPLATPPFPTGAPGLGLTDIPASRTFRILIVDDNSDHTDSLAALLRMSGHEIATAYDAEGALVKAISFRPEVVLLDIGMPRINGYELARRLRLEPWGEAAILVALTGWGQSDDRRRSREAGIDHHLTKPVEFAALAKLLSVA